MGDAVIAAFFAADKPKAREKKRRRSGEFSIGIAGKGNGKKLKARHGDVARGRTSR